MAEHYLNKHMNTVWNTTIAEKLGLDCEIITVGRGLFHITLGSDDVSGVTGEAYMKYIEENIGLPVSGAIFVYNKTNRKYVASANIKRFELEDIEWDFNS